MVGLRLAWRTPELGREFVDLIECLGCLRLLKERLRAGFGRAVGSIQVVDLVETLVWASVVVDQKGHKPSTVFDIHHLVFEGR